MSKKCRFKEILSVILSVLICVGIYLYVRSGSLTPPGAPGSTMVSLSDIAGSGFASTTHSLVEIKDALTAATSTPAGWTCTLRVSACGADVSCVGNEKVISGGRETFSDFTCVTGAGGTLYKNRPTRQGWSCGAISIGSKSYANCCL